MQLTFPLQHPYTPYPGPCQGQPLILSRSLGPHEHTHTYCLSPGKPKGHPHMLHRQAFSSLPSAPGPSHKLTTLNEGGGSAVQMSRVDGETAPGTRG